MQPASGAVDLRYPVGRFERPQSIDAADRAAFIAIIDSLPAKLRETVSSMTPREIDTAYRPGGWTVRQVVHHLADSHMNSFIRFKLALTEEAPTIKSYDEGAWAELPDTKAVDVGASLDLIAGLHHRWTAMLRAMDEAQFARTFTHPELGRVPLDVNLALYAWHCRHHLAHVESVRSK
jgi:hypothetical protein